MNSKRICAICILVLLLGSCIGAVLPVNAESNWTAALKIEGVQENAREKTITVRVSVEQITCQSGIFLAEYDVHYDNSVLKLISWENSKPAGWTFSGSNADAEDWTKTKQTSDSKKETYLSYTLLNVSTSNGVKRNGQLYTDLRFKVLSDSAKTAEITVTNITFADVALGKCRLPDQKRTINLNDNSNSSASSAESTSSSAQESSGVSSDSSSGRPGATESSDEPEESSSPASESSIGGDESTNTPVSSSSSSEPSTETSTEPSAEPSTDPSTESSSDSSAGISTDSPSEPTSDPSSETTSDASTEPSSDPSAESSADPSTGSSTSPSSDPSSDEAPSGSDDSRDETSKTVRMWITVEDITDPSGVSSLSFTLKYNADFLKYVSHECLLPEDWDLRSEYTEDLTETAKGSITFRIVNREEGHGVKENGKLGVLVEFTFAGTDFDPSLLTIENMHLFNGEINEMSVDSYRLATRYEFDGEVISDDIFSSVENEGGALKIWIAVIAAVAVLAGSVVTFLVIRKKKLA